MQSWMTKVSLISCVTQEMVGINAILKVNTSEHEDRSSRFHRMQKCGLELFVNRNPLPQMHHSACTSLLGLGIIRLDNPD
jgi:hypothetical protein